MNPSGAAERLKPTLTGTEIEYVDRHIKKVVGKSPNQVKLIATITLFIHSKLTGGGMLIHHYSVVQ